MAAAEMFVRKRKAEEMDIGDRKYGLDMDILECPICSELFSTPVFQCQSGHTVCSACYAKITKCPSCAQPVSTFIRNLLAERIVESLLLRCPYAHHGCSRG